MRDVETRCRGFAIRDCLKFKSYNNEKAITHCVTALL